MVRVMRKDLTKGWYNMIEREWGDKDDDTHTHKTHTKKHIQ